MEEVRRILVDSFGEDADDGPYGIYSGGLWVRTSYDPDMQAKRRNRACATACCASIAGRPLGRPGRDHPDGGWRMALAPRQRQPVGRL